MQDTEDRSGLSRRTVMAGAAWAVPAVVTAAAVPAYASSTTRTQVGISIAAATTGQLEPTITLSLTTSAPPATLVSGTTATFEITVYNGSATPDAPINLTPGTTTPASGVTITDPGLQNILRGASFTFTVTLGFTTTGPGTTSASVPVAVAGWAKGKGMTLSVKYLSGTTAASNGTLIPPTINPVPFTN